MSQEMGFCSACWEVGVPKDEVEDLLAKIRKQSSGVIVQVIGAARAPNPSAIEMIAAQTLMAARSGSMLAERPELDLLLRLAGTRQIGEAFRRIGYKSDRKRFFMVAASEDGGNEIIRMGERLVADKRFTAIPKRKLAEVDLEQVERAALLAARL